MNKKEDNKNNENKKKEKALYTCDAIIDEEEYKKFYKQFPRFYWSFVLFSSMINLILLSIISLIFKNLVLSLFIFIIYQGLIMIWYSIRMEIIAEKTFKNLSKKEKIEKEFTTYFYDDFFIRKSNTITMNIKYSDISKCIETDTNFYLEYPKDNKIIILQKNRCDLELINFIRDKFDNIENRIGENNLKVVRVTHSTKFIKNGMIILFVLVILSLWFALYTYDAINNLIPQHGLNYTKNAWVFWLWLPLPIISIILGIKYKNGGFKCTKNIVGGFIMGFFLLAFGSFYFFPSDTVDYNKINNYKSILDINIPADGELQIQEWNVYSEEDKNEFTVIDAYYDNVDVSSLERSIKNNENWIYIKDIKSELKIYIPTDPLILYSKDNVYYSFYNQSLNEYNKIPDNSGEYQIYFMRYDMSEKKLSIYKYKFLYK